MRRDMDLIRELMLKLEALDLPYRGAMTLSPDNPKIAVQGRTDVEIGYHLDQIEMLGFLQPSGAGPMRGITFRGLTPAGHEFIEDVRNNDAWKATKDRASRMGNFGLSFVTDLAKAWAKAKAAEHGWM